MKNNKFILQILLLGLLGGCSTFEAISQKASTLTSSIPREVENEALGKVNTETQLYSIGSATITDSGLHYSASKALDNSREKLKVEIEKEANLIFKSFTLEMDSHRKKIFSPIIPDLILFIAQNQISNAVESGDWNDEDKSYILLTVERENIRKYSEEVFSNYVSELIKKLETSVKVKSNSLPLPIKTL